MAAVKDVPPPITVFVTKFLASRLLELVIYFRSTNVCADE